MGLKDFLPLYSMSHYDITYYIASGEKFQQLADIYIGTTYDFKYNPLIWSQQTKHKQIESIVGGWNNHTLIFCYSNHIEKIAKYLQFFKNKCVIIFGNSDENITYTKCKPIIDSDIILHIYCQNLMFSHSKVSYIPIGVANRQWAHGKIEYFMSLPLYDIQYYKLSHILLSMSLHTNAERAACASILLNKGIPNRRFSDYKDYLLALSTAKFCICPDGNGIDTHRLWETLYVKTIPILRRSAFTDILVAAQIPCIVVSNWSDLDIPSLPDYSTYSFDDEYISKISFITFKNDILTRFARVG